MAYKVIILYQLYMPSYVLGTFTEYPDIKKSMKEFFMDFIMIKLRFRSSEHRQLQ